MLDSVSFRTYAVHAARDIQPQEREHIVFSDKVDTTDSIHENRG
jgi:hypothetical protein